MTVRVDCRQPFETFIDVQSEENGRYSVLKISTGDRPGLLTDIVRILKDISVNVVSAEVHPPPVPCRLTTSYLSIVILLLEL
jgi:UTP:GlnB (protein PII) uridylyltransferase